MMNSILLLGTYHQKIVDALMTEYYMCNQSIYVKIFMNAINEELQDYTARVVSAQESILYNSDKPLTLLRLYNISLEYIKILQPLSIIVEECYMKKYHYIISYLHTCAQSELSRTSESPVDLNFNATTVNGPTENCRSLCVNTRFKEVSNIS